MKPTPFIPLPQNTVAVILAAGAGTRAGPQPKQYAPILNSSPLQLTASFFAASHNVGSILPVIAKHDISRSQQALQSIPNVLPHVIGGDQRQDSLLNALLNLSQNRPNDAQNLAVVIHDAARPFPSQTVLNNLLHSLKKHHGAFPALPLNDALKHNPSLAPADRNQFLLAQTPQAFRFLPLLKALQQHKNLAHDEAHIAHCAGLSVTSVPGDPLSFKITSPHDLILARSLLAASPRVGHGYDRHQLAPNIPLILCGVPIPHTHGPVARSDGDAPLHALTDALLAALGYDDIGALHPQTDPKTLNAPSSSFLKHALSLAQQQCADLANVSLVIICQSPKLSSYRNDMRLSIAKLLNLNLNQVAVHLKSGEGIGFIGRQEGIAAHASVILHIPHPFTESPTESK